MKSSEVVLESFRKTARDLYVVQIANGRTQGTRIPLPTKVTKRGLDCVLGLDWGRYRVECGEVDTV